MEGERGTDVPSRCKRDTLSAMNVTGKVNRWGTVEAKIPEHEEKAIEMT